MSPVPLAALAPPANAPVVAAATEMLALTPLADAPALARVTEMPALKPLADAPALAPLANVPALAPLLLHSELLSLAFVRGETLIFANAAFGRLVGQADNLCGTPLAALIAPIHKGRITDLLLDAVSGPAACIAELSRGDVSVAEIELRACLLSGGQGLCAIVAQDVTDRSRAAARLGLLAFSDPLTGLANRALLYDRLRLAVLGARQKSSTGFAVIALDLDGFKPVNDRYGHAAGDVVLQHVALRLQVGLRATETIARLGGDEFAVLLDHLQRPTDAVAVTERVLAAIRRPILAGGHVVSVAASAGLACFPDHGRTVEQLLVAADTALYTAKRAGGGSYAWASQRLDAAPAPAQRPWSAVHDVGVPEMDAQHRGLAELLGALGEALYNGLDPRPRFREFVRAAARHFADEERLMVESNYADAAAHRGLHQRLLADVDGMVLEGEGISPSSILRYLHEWLFRHIDGPDREFAAAYRRHSERGPEARANREAENDWARGG